MSRRGRVDVAIRLEGSGGADPGVVGVVDVGLLRGNCPTPGLGEFFFFFFVCEKKRQGHQSMELTWTFSETHLQI